MWKRISILFVSLWIYGNAFSQSPNIIFRHITRSNGLPADNVTCLAQDSSGFIWIGTTEGLFRFDGFTYKAFYSSAEKKTPLYGNYIRNLLVDSKGRLWISTGDKGLSILDPGTDQVKQVLCTLSNERPIIPSCTAFKEDSKGNIWISTANGLLKYSYKKNAWDHYIMEPKPGRNFLLGPISIDNLGRLIISGYSGLWIFDPASEKFKVEESKLKKAFEKMGYFRSSFLYNNNLWYSTWVPDFGVYNLQDDKLQIIYSDAGTKQPDFTKMATCFYADSKGGLWIGTGEGLHFVADKKDKIQFSFTYEADNKYSLISNKINDILEDREGNIWIATEEGISIAEPYMKKALNYSVNSLHDFPFGDKQVNVIVELDNHDFLIGTHYADGIYQTDSQFKVQRKFYFENTDWDWIWKHYKDEKTKQVYISTQKGMLVYDQKLKNIRKSTNDFWATHYPAASFVPLSDDEIWISCFRNVFYKYNLHTGSYKEYNISLLGEPSQVLFLSSDKENNIWIMGHSSGLFRFDRQKEKIVERLVPDSTLNSIRQPGIYVFLDLGESFLIGYDSHGISLYHKKTKTFEHFTSNEGLAGNRVRDAFIAKDKTVWIATGNGVSHFFPDTKTFVNYNQEQGILQNDLQCIFPVRDSLVAAGTNKGIFVFNPKEAIKYHVPPPPIISEINVLGEKISLNNIEQHLSLSYRENYFSFDFISLLYSNNNLVEYAYRLEGLQDEWIACGNRRFVSYSNVPAGHYTFKVKCRLPGGQWIENKKSLLINMQAAFYTRWWFFLIIAFVAAAVLYGMFRYRIQQLLRLEKMRSTISSDLHDEVGSSLTSISIFSEMARKTVTPLSKEDQYLLRIGDRSRDSIEKMSDIIWSINPNSDSLQQMMVRMKNYTNEIAEAKDITIYWEESSNLPQIKLSMEQRKNIYLLYKEAVNNVIKHSGAKNIYILLQSLKNGMTLRIRDDGKGFDSASANAGNGLKNMKRRAVLLNGTIDIISDSANGTSIQLFIPY